MRLHDIRTQFLNYFAGQGHTVVPSAPLVPHDDPTLMFTAAGMVPFKNVFTGQETRAYTRAVSSQKCVRAGGKHNDLENVGYTARHHTFFEMLGNFSFGDYFKEEAIFHAWNVVTKEFGLSPDRLWVTVFHEDQEAFDLWRKIAGLSADRIIKIDTDDNFWSMGDTGPCGPCSEIFFDHGPSIAGGLPGSPEQDGDRFVEIWNLVFMQYNQPGDGTRQPLPRPSIDTGMGLERLAAVLQGVHDNYDTDLFVQLIENSAALSGVAPEGPFKASHRVIADHLRASAFLIADGITPANEGRGYVLRRIMRRAMRHVHLLGQTRPMMHMLVPTLVNAMGDAYPELTRAAEVITQTLEAEEERFQETLGRGLKLLSQETARLGSGQTLSGEIAFKLYDTFGFPLDLTQDILRAEHKTVDLEGFESAMSRQKAAARAAWAGSGTAAEESIWFDVARAQPVSAFLGYEGCVSTGEVVALVQGDQQVAQADTGQSVEIVLNQTPFYAESGGQMGDTGFLQGPNVRVRITDTRKKRGTLIVHSGIVESGILKMGDTVEAEVDESRRLQLRAHHSATHLLHGALRQMLGAGVTQKGSLVAPDKLRFDFSLNRALTTSEIHALEDQVNTAIRANVAIETRLMSPQSAQESGAMALFGEKYGDEVRVVRMGAGAWESVEALSVELCGGTHAARTGDIGYFKIFSDSSVASGVRRIEAVVGAAAESAMRERESALQAAADLLRVAPLQVPERVQVLLVERKQQEQDLRQARKNATGSGQSAAAVQQINGVAYLYQHLEEMPAKELKSLADRLKAQMGSGIVMLTSTCEGKVSIVIGVTPDLIPTYNAVDLVRVAAAAVGGQGGGGRPDMAQAGGNETQAIPEAEVAVRQKI